MMDGTGKHYKQLREQLKWTVFPGKHVIAFANLLN